MFILQQGGCAEKKMLKQELSSSELKALKSSPDCVKAMLIDNYENSGDLDELSIIKTELNGENVYFVDGGTYQWQFFNEDCNRYEGKIFGQNLNENTTLIVGDSKKIPPPPPPAPPKIKLNETAEKPSTKKPDTVPNSSTTAPPMSDCINNKIDDFIENGTHLSMSQLFAYSSKGQVYYFFDHGMAVDGPAYVLNEQCDTVCVTGGMRRGNPQAKPCPEEDGKSRRMIWVQGKGRVD